MDYISHSMVTLFCINRTKQEEQTAADASPISNSGLLRELQHLATVRDLIPHSSVSYMLITCVFSASVSKYELLKRMCFLGMQEPEKCNSLF